MDLHGYFATGHGGSGADPYNFDLDAVSPEETSSRSRRTSNATGGARFGIGQERSSQAGRTPTRDSSRSSSGARSAAIPDDRFSRSRRSSSKARQEDALSPPSPADTEKRARFGAPGAHKPAKRTSVEERVAARLAQLEKERETKIPGPGLLETSMDNTLSTFTSIAFEPTAHATGALVPASAFGDVEATNYSSEDFEEDAAAAVLPGAPVDQSEISNLTSGTAVTLIPERTSFTALANIFKDTLAEVQQTAVPAAVTVAGTDTSEPVWREESKQAEDLQINTAARDTTSSSTTTPVMQVIAEPAPDAEQVTALPHASTTVVITPVAQPAEVTVTERVDETSSEAASPKTTTQRDNGYKHPQHEAQMVEHKLAPKHRSTKRKQSKAREAVTAQSDVAKAALTISLRSAAAAALSKIIQTQDTPQVSAQKRNCQQVGIAQLPAWSSILQTASPKPAEAAHINATKETFTELRGGVSPVKGVDVDGAAVRDNHRLSADLKDVLHGAIERLTERCIQPLLLSQQPDHVGKLETQVQELAGRVTDLGVQLRVTEAVQSRYHTPRARDVSGDDRTSSCSPCPTTVAPVSPKIANVVHVSDCPAAREKVETRPATMEHSPPPISISATTAEVSTTPLPGVANSTIAPAANLPGVQSWLQSLAKALWDTLVLVDCPTGKGPLQRYAEGERSSLSRIALYESASDVKMAAERAGLRAYVPVRLVELLQQEVESQARILQGYEEDNKYLHNALKSVPASSSSRIPSVAQRSLQELQDECDRLRARVRGLEAEKVVGTNTIAEVEDLRAHLNRSVSSERALLQTIQQLEAKLAERATVHPAIPERRSLRRAVLCSLEVCPSGSATQPILTQGAAQDELQASLSDYQHQVKCLSKDLLELMGQLKEAKDAQQRLEAWNQQNTAKTQQETLASTKAHQSLQATNDRLRMELAEATTRVAASGAARDGEMKALRVQITKLEGDLKAARAEAKSSALARSRAEVEKKNAGKFEPAQPVKLLPKRAADGGKPTKQKQPMPPPPPPAAAETAKMTSEAVCDGTENAETRMHAAAVSTADMELLRANMLQYKMRAEEAENGNDELRHQLAHAKAVIRDLESAHRFCATTLAEPSEGEVRLGTKLDALEARLAERELQLAAAENQAQQGVQTVERMLVRKYENMLGAKDEAIKTALLQLGKFAEEIASLKRGAASS